MGGRRVPLDHFARRHAAGAGHLVQVGPEIAAITHGDIDQARLPNRAFDAAGQQLGQAALQASMGRIAGGIAVDPFGPIVHGHRGERGHDVRHTRDRVIDQVIGEGVHRSVDARIDPLAEFDHQAAFAQRVDAPAGRVGVGHAQCSAVGQESDGGRPGQARKPRSVG